MKKNFFLFFLLFLNLSLLITHSLKAQAPVANFSCTASFALPKDSCYPMQLTFNNTTTGVYDSANWYLDVSSTGCNGPWTGYLHQTKSGVNSHQDYTALLVTPNFYRLCLRVANSATGQVNTYCQCIGRIFPTVQPGFVVGTPIGCGQVTTNIYATNPGTVPPYTFIWYLGACGSTITTTCNGIPSATSGNVSASCPCLNTTKPCYGIFCLITDANGCQAVASDSCAVKAYCNPTASISVAASASTCVTGQPVTMTASPTGMTKYSWWVPAASGAPTNGPLRTNTLTTSFPSFGCYDVKLLVYDSLTPSIGCVDSAILPNAVCLQGIQTTSPVPSFSVSPNLVCCGSPFQVSFTAQTNPTSSCCIQASFSAVPVAGSPACATTVNLGTVQSCNGLPGTQFFSIPCRCSSAVTYKIVMDPVITNMCSNCTATVSSNPINVVVNPAPVASISLMNGYVSSYCAPCHKFGFQAGTNVSNLPGYTWEWHNNSTCSPPNASTTSTDTVTFCGNGTVASPSQQHFVCLKICQSVANGGCCSYANDTVTLTKPYGDFTYNAPLGCGIVCDSFKATVKTDSLYKWIVWDANGVTATIQTGVNAYKFAHCFTGFPNKDTCYNVMLVHTTYSNGGVACFDTILKKKIIRVGHHVTAAATLSKTQLCLKHATVYTYPTACLKFIPDNQSMQIIPSPTVQLSQCSNISCNYYFTKQVGNTQQIVAQSYNCDTPTVCFTQTGNYTAHFIVTDNACTDTLTLPTQVCVSGIIADIVDSVHCANQGNYTPIVTYKPSLKFYACNGLPNLDSFKVHIWNKSTNTNILDTTIDTMGKLPPRINYTYSSGGTYLVCMSVYDKFHAICDTDTICKNVLVFPFTAVINLVNSQPTIACRDFNSNRWVFTANQSSPANPPISKWVWGDGTPNTLNTDPATHTFDTCGIFQVKLTISSASGACQDSAHFTVQVHDIQDSSGKHNNLFSIKPLSGSCNRCLTFKNKAVYCHTALDSVVIDFGDGSPKAVIHGSWDSTVHCYTKTTNIYPTVTYHDIYGCVVSKTVAAPQMTGITANFTGLPDTVLCVGTCVTLTDASAGYVYYYKWSLSSAGCATHPYVDSSNVSTFPPPAQSYCYTFSQPGVYYLDFNPSNFYTDPTTGHHCQSDTCVRIDVKNTVADFYIADTFPCPGNVVNVPNLTTGAYDHLVVTLTLPNSSVVTYTYDKYVPPSLPPYVSIPLGYPGNYSLSFYASSTLGCNSTKSKTFVVQGPLGAFHALSRHICLGGTINFVDTTNSSNGVLVDWDGDGTDQYPYDSTHVYNFSHQFMSCGKKQVLAYISDGNCIYPISDTVNVDCPKAQFAKALSTTDFCGSASVQLNDLSLSSSPHVYGTTITSHLWQLIDTNNLVVQTSVAVNPVFNIHQDGSYAVKLTIQTNWGCIDSTIQRSIIHIYKYATPQFTISPDTICINGCINFANTSINPDTGALHSRWYFNWSTNTLTSNLNTPQQCYTTAGTFNVVLIDTTMHGCVDTSAAKTVLVLPSITPNFSISDTMLCGSNKKVVAFTNTSIPLAGLNYCWNFGDSLQGVCQSTAVNPSHTFQLPTGVASACYTIKLIVKNSVGCEDSISKRICLYSNPIAKLIPDHSEACHPLKVEVNDSSSSLNPITAYDLHWGDGSDTTIFPSGITHAYADTGTYFIHYKITTQQGCSDSVTIAVIDHAYPIPCAGKDDTICAQQQLTLGCPSLPMSGYNYSWSTLTNVGTPFSFIAHPVITAFNNESYILTMVSTGYACPAWDTMNVTVIPLVVPSTSNDAAVCLGYCATLSASGGLTYSWTDSSNHVISTDSVITVCPSSPTKYNVTICGKCDCQTLSINVDVFTPPAIILEHSISGDNIIAGHDITIPPVISPGTGSVVWRPNYNFNNNDTTNASPTVHPDVTTTYHVYVTDGHGCVDSSDVTIHVLCNSSNAIYVPNAFTPETPGAQGGHNDRFYVQGKGVKEINYFRIYDRWGGIVYSAEHIQINDPSVGWDGTSTNGKPLSSDVFMYQMQVQCSEGTVFPLTGTFTLIR